LKDFGFSFSAIPSSVKCAITYFKLIPQTKKCLRVGGLCNHLADIWLLIALHLQLQYGSNIGISILPLRQLQLFGNHTIRERVLALFG